jgi:hypothetical protein
MIKKIARVSTPQEIWLEKFHLILSLKKIIIYIVHDFNLYSYFVRR